MVLLGEKHPGWSLAPGSRSEELPKVRSCQTEQAMQTYSMVLCVCSSHLILMLWGIKGRVCAPSGWTAVVISGTPFTSPWARVGVTLAPGGSHRERWFSGLRVTAAKFHSPSSRGDASFNTNLKNPSFSLLWKVAISALKALQNFQS